MVYFDELKAFTVKGVKHTSKTTHTTLVDHTDDNITSESKSKTFVEFCIDVKGEKPWKVTR